MTIPAVVIEALAAVRESAVVNMLDRRGVTRQVSNGQAREWLEKASDAEYTDALTQMGETVSDDAALRALEVEGQKLASKHHWDGFEILEVCKAALADANFHREADVIEQMINALNEDDNALFELKVLPSVE